MDSGKRKGSGLTNKSDREQVVKSNCRTCHGGCGVLVHLKDGFITRIEGDPDFPTNHGAMCGKGLATLQLVYHPDRLKYPLERVGNKGKGRWQRRYVAAHCMHCSQPMCRDRCPVDAIIRREDGIVLIDGELCIGCKGCVDACPLGVMQFDEEKGIAGKCDLCVGRIDMGLKPACVAACPGHCIYYGDVSHITGQLGKHKLLVRYKAIAP